MKIIGGKFLFIIIVACFLSSNYAHPEDVDRESDPIVAVVNGKSVYRSDVVMYHQSLPQQYNQMPIEMLYAQLLEGLVQRTYIAQEARALGLHDDTIVRQRINWIEESVLQEIYIDRMLALKLSDDRLRIAYQKVKDSWVGEEEVHARHILLETERTAIEVIAALQQGADFSQVARESSIGPSADSGGDLGYFPESAMVAEFAKAAFAMRPGDISSEPVQTEFGWHVIMIEDRRFSVVPSYEDMSKSLRDQETVSIVSEILERLEKRADIQRFNLDGTELVMPTGESINK